MRPLRTLKPLAPAARVSDGGPSIRTWRRMTLVPSAHHAAVIEPNSLQTSHVLSPEGLTRWSREYLTRSGMTRKVSPNNSCSNDSEQKGQPSQSTPSRCSPKPAHLVFRLFHRLEGLFFPADGGGDMDLVAINSGRPITRQRYSAAHELCHLLKDRNVSGSFIAR